MSAIVVAVVIGFITFFFFAMIGIIISQSQKKVDDRLERYAAGRGRGGLGGQAAEAEGKRSSFIVQQVDRAVAKKRFATGIALQLAQADLKLSVGEFLIINFMSVLLCSFLFYVLGGSAFMAPIGAVVGFFLPRLYVNMRKRARLKAFNDQLGDTITLMANALRAGYSLIQAMEAVSREMPPPISEEFARVVKEVGLGLTQEEAMNHLLERVRSEDLDLLITAINVQHEVGGNLAEILDSIGFTIRERVRILGEVRVLTAQGMLSGYVISFLPIGLMAILFLINRDYIGAMFKEPCGWAMLAVMAIMITAGFIAIQKIVRIDV